MAHDYTPTLQAKVTANEVSSNGMMEGWWHRDALSRNRTSAFGMQLVPDDDSVSGLIPSGLLSNSLDRSRQFSEIISSKYQSDAEFAEVIAHELEKRQSEVNYASAALGVGAIVNTAGRIAITEGGSATIGYLTKVAGGYAISYAGAAATEFGIDQAQKNGLVTANQATATRMGIALFQIVVATRQARAEARAKTSSARAQLALPAPQSNIGSSLSDVTKSVFKIGRLPDNFITKPEAEALGWNPKAGNLSLVAPGKSIGGDVFRNNKGGLPSAPGRVWFEADLNFGGGYRGTERLLYSNDGRIFYTGDHYKTFQPLGGR